MSTEQIQERAKTELVRHEDGMPESPNGYCIDMFEGSVWLRRDGSVTPNWDERGIWPTLEEAQAFMREQAGRP